VFDILHKLKRFLKKAFTPVTIMFVPHSKTRPLNIRVPFFAILGSIILWCFGTVYIFTITVNTIEYYKMKDRVDYYSQEFTELSTTMSAIRGAEKEFRRLFSLESKEKVLEHVDISDSGSIDMENLKKQVRSTIEDVGEIRDYLHVQRDIYMSTPKGLPVKGRISSPYGKRKHPMNGTIEFHSGLDISARSGCPVQATADGIVSFSGWSGGNGYLVVLEHGHGFSTFYAHNKKNAVEVGQKVKRDDVIGYVGTTGSSTGPHVHYEIWKNGKHVNPKQYIGGKS
jgi:murein DD-endopeptidase MepM/ murein hydrolase activator NlpD